MTAEYAEGKQCWQEWNGRVVDSKERQANKGMNSGHTKGGTWENMKAVIRQSCRERREPKIEAKGVYDIDARI